MNKLKAWFRSHDKGMKWAIGIVVLIAIVSVLTAIFTNG